MLMGVSRGENRGWFG